MTAPMIPIMPEQDNIILGLAAAWVVMANFSPAAMLRIPPMTQNAISKLETGTAYHQAGEQEQEQEQEKIKTCR